MALGIEIEDGPFAKSTLQVFRAQLILHDKVREVFEQSLRMAREAGYLKGKGGMRVAMDTTYILGRGAVKDTYNLLADGIVKLMRALSTVEGVPVRRWAEAHGYKRYVGSSVKGEAAIDWSNRRARRRLLGQIVADADRLLELARQAQDALDADSVERQAIVDAAELLGQLLLQDVKRGGDGGTRQAFAHAGRRLVPECRDVPTGSVSPRMTSSSTCWRAVAPVRRVRSPAPSCRRGNAPTVLGRCIACKPSGSTARCARAVCYGPDALRPRAGRDGRC